MNKYIALITFLFYSTIGIGQVETNHINMSTGEYEGLEILLPIDIKKAEKLWQEYTKPFGKVERDKKNNEYILYNVQISSISHDAISILSRFDQNGNSTKASYLIKSGNDYINDQYQPNEILNTKAFLQEFIFEAERLNFREVLKDEEKALSSLSKNHENLIKQNKGFHKDIEKARTEIAQNERKIEANVADQKQSQKDIEAQRDIIREITIKLTNVGKSSY